MNKKSLSLDKFSAKNYSNIDAYYGMSRADKIRFKKIIENIGTNQKILDIGCYEGSMGVLIQEKNNKVIGIDITMPGLIGAIKKGIICICSDLSKSFPFKNESFDTIIAGEIIEHIIDTDFFIEEIKRILKPAGKIIITTPNTASFGRRLLLLMGINPHFEASLTFPSKPAGHVRYYTSDLLISFLEYHGLKIEELTSNVINFTGSGSISSQWLAKLFPGLGSCLIIIAKK